MAAYLRRPDGTLEIVRPKRQRKRLRSVLSTVGAVVSVALVPVVALVVYVSMGMTLVIVALALLGGALAYVALRKRQQVAPPVHGAAIRLVRSEERGSPAHLGRIP